MLVHTVRFDQPLVKVVLELKDPFLDKYTKKKITDAYIEKLQTGKEPKDFGDYAKLVEKQRITHAEYYKTKEPLYNEIEVELDNPLPPLPLIFRFGGFQLRPCVIHRMAVDVIRHTDKAITACNLDLVLHEIIGSDPWAIPTSVAGRRKVIDLQLDLTQEARRAETKRRIETVQQTYELNKKLEELNASGDI
jgi:hypothetical protein